MRKSWNRKRVLAELKARGTSLRAIGDQLGYAPTSIYGVFRTSMPRAEAAIAAVLGTKPHLIWPSRYDQDGDPIGWSRMKAVINSKFGGGNVKTGEAA
jgi:Ner family transcriptional regulator